MPTIITDSQRKILYFMVEVYDREIHGPLDLETIVSGTRIWKTFAERDLEEGTRLWKTFAEMDLADMKEKGLVKMSSAKIYAVTPNGRAKINKD